MKLYEIYSIDTTVPDVPRTLSTYHQSEGPTVKEARELKKLGVPVAVYECRLATTTRVETVFLLLNARIRPKRGDLIFGRDYAALEACVPVDAL